jgi:anti-anti-sigma factor
VPVRQTLVRSSRIDGGRYVLSIAGDLDVDVVPSVRTRLDELIHNGADTIVVDLFEVSLIDAGGFSVLGTVAETLDAKGGELILVTDSADLGAFFANGNGGRPFHVETSLWEAVNRVDERQV